jgi:hypothetical protein
LLTISLNLYNDLAALYPKRPIPIAVILPNY